MVKKINNKLQIDYINGIIEDRLLQIIPKDPSVNVLKLIPIWAVEIDPRNSNKILAQFKEFQDPANLQHIKRIKKINKETLCIVVSSHEYMSTEDEVKAKLEELGVTFANLQSLNVPNHGPTIKELAHEWTESYWPLIWKGNPNDQVLNDTKINMVTIKKFLQMITDKSNEVAQSSPDKLPIVTLVAKNDELITISVDERSPLAPLNHSIMSCIETIGSSQKEINDSHHQYLLQDYQVFSTHEPCSMCCMALIHSRVSRLVYLKESKKTGALKQSSGEGYCIHNNYYLNSSYEVWEWIGDEYQVPNLDEEVNA